MNMLDCAFSLGVPLTGGVGIAVAIISDAIELVLDLIKAANGGALPDIFACGTMWGCSGVLVGK